MIETTADRKEYDFHRVLEYYPECSFDSFTIKEYSILFEHGPEISYLDFHQYIQCKMIRYERELMHAQIIRDADKLDNCRVKLETAIETLLGVTAEQVGMSEITPEVMQQFKNHKSILLKTRKTKMNYWISPYIVKDYVKSRKHEWYDACFIKNISDIANTTRVIRNFVERQGDSLVGGIVLRKFMGLHQIGFHERSGMPISEEYRIFVYAGKILIMDNYWTEKEDVRLSDVEISWIECIAKKVRSNFVTIDIARKDDDHGIW